MDDPSTNGANGRRSDGRFVVGNPGGPGNPFLAFVNRWRAAFHRELKPRDIKAVVKMLMGIVNDGKAKPADRIAAGREILNRGLGTAAPADLLERIERLEQQMESNTDEP